MFALQFFGGLFGLLLGADMAVGGCIRLARRWNLPPWVTGMLLLALGTSLPEFFVGLSASAEHPGLALGTVFGSNAVNVGGVFALMLIFAKKGIPLREAGIPTTFALVLGSGLAFWAFSKPTPSVVASSVLLGLFAFVIWTTLRDGRRRKNTDPVSSMKESFLTSLLLAMGGFVLLAFSTTFFVDGALGFADFFGWHAQAKLMALARQYIGLPSGPMLEQNFPNPFNSQTSISFFLPTPESVRLEVFALNGQQVVVLASGPRSAGAHQIFWDTTDAAGRPVASGTYLYRLVTPTDARSRKLTLLR